MYWYRMNGDSEVQFADLGATVKCPPYSVVLYPKWQQRYNLTYHKNDGSSTDTTFVSYVAKEYTPYEGFVREGYIFAGWYKDTAFTMYQSFPIDVTENTDLYARWEAEE